MIPQVAIISGGSVLDILPINLLSEYPAGFITAQLPLEHNVGIGDKYLNGCFVRGSKTVRLSELMEKLSPTSLASVFAELLKDAEKNAKYLALANEVDFPISDTRLRAVFSPAQLYEIFISGG